MTHQNPPEHFKGNTVAAHLKDARARGAAAMAETHAAELPGHFSALADSAKDTAIAFLLIFAAASGLNLEPFSLFIAFGLGWALWKGGRSALLGWGKLERLHRLIEEERWEIEHHREQEKMELREMYEAKGFKGKLLDEVVNVLMADDNRLLQIMLQEELGLTLEAYEHPLKQGFGAAIGALGTAILALIAHYFWPFMGVPLIAFLVIFIASNSVAKFEKREKIASVIWNLALALFAAGGVYFLAKLLKT